MNGILKILTSYILLVVILTACVNNNEDSTPSKSSLTVFSYKLNGREIKSDIVSSFKYFSSLYPESRLEIQAFKGADSLVINCPAIVKTHIMDVSGKTSVQIRKGGKDYTFTQGTVSITKLTSEKISGTFSCSMPESNLFPAFIVTDGAFNNVTLD